MHGTAFINIIDTASHVFLTDFREIQNLTTIKTFYCTILLTENKQIDAFEWKAPAKINLFIKIASLFNFVLCWLVIVIFGILHISCDIIRTIYFVESVFEPESPSATQKALILKLLRVKKKTKRDTPSTRY